MISGLRPCVQDEIQIKYVVYTSESIYLCYICLTYILTLYSPCCLHWCSINISNLYSRMDMCTCIYIYINIYIYHMERCICFVMWFNRRLKCKARVHKCVVGTSKDCVLVSIFVLITFCFVAVLFLLLLCHVLDG